ncbi:MAG TPA: VanW family protein, partial [Kofleriaceae bacterium]|nr:VanW family protein [Kofleriaceae bacterium]
VAALQARRLVARAGEPAAPAPGDGQRFAHVAYRRALPIVRADGDPLLEQGKQINLALAAPHFHGLVLSAARPLSFWRALGRVSAARGFRHGVELRGGCIVPTIGGGLCLLSNELFRAASLLGWTILERHGHTLQAVPPADDLPWGMDATVFWPHVDLRVAPAAGDAWLGVRVTGGQLTVEVRTHQPVTAITELVETDAAETDPSAAGDGIWRTGRVLRIVRDAGGAVLARDIIAVNRKRLLDATEQRRNCLTCDEPDCHARPGDLPRRS